MKHIKKILNNYFEAVADGSKTFEIRNEDDCTYKVGDLIELIEIKPENNAISPTGRKQLVEVTYRLSHDEFPQGIQAGYVVLGIKLRWVYRGV